jgi:hypothetical protein
LSRLHFFPIISQCWKESSILYPQKNSIVNGFLRTEQLQPTFISEPELNLIGWFLN